MAIEASRQDQYDLLIVGGGINGAGIARDASGRGLKVLLVEQDDLAGYTSSSSTKLIHGGLRYLEYYEFRLVREALQERERLVRIAPHIIWPLRFVLPHQKHLRPAWLLRLGLFLYDHIGGKRTLPGSHGVRFDRSALGNALKPALKRGFVYSDAWVQDSRLVVLNAMDAARRGAEIRTRTQLVRAERAADGHGWQATILDRASGESREVSARILVNAAGPWVSELLRQRLGLNKTQSVRLVKGSHIVVPRLYEGSHAYILQNPDKRIIFTIPYEDRFTLIGTTDIPYDKEPGKVTISGDEVSYLCAAVNDYFTAQIQPSDVVWSYAGVRPLFDDASENASAVTRDYVLDVDTGGSGAPLLSIFGGKITTFRRLAEHAMEKLQPFLSSAGSAWTGTGTLPGGDLGAGGFDAFLTSLRRKAPFLGDALSWRLARNYGSRAYDIVGDATTRADLGEDFGGDLTAREVDYLIAEEWARTAEDILWRRSRLGLHVPEEGQVRLERYVNERLEKQIQTPQAA